MFTIKHVKTDGCEEIHAGYLPSFVSKDSLEGRERGNAVVHFNDEKGSEQTLRWGKVYIVNDIGKTVASYDLGDSLLGNQMDSTNSPNLAYQNPPLSRVRNQVS